MWTTEQQNAIDAPVTDILVTAAAGSGKTAVMVERIISRVLSEDGVDIDKILVVTYTNAAAAEIRERITQKILENLDTCDTDSALKDQLVLINRASICTIHSFCLDIIRSNFHLLSLDPNFRIGDTTEVELLKIQAVNEVFDEKYESDDDEFLRLVNAYTKKTDESLVGIVKNVYEFSKSMPNSEKWLDDIEAKYSVENNVCLDFLLETAVYSAEYAVMLYEKAIDLCRFDSALDGWQSTLFEEKSMFETFISSCRIGWNSAYKVFADYKFAIKRKVKGADESVQEKIKNYRDEARAIAKTIKTAYINAPLCSVKEDFDYVLLYIKKITELVRLYSDRFSRLKSERNIIDFSDFEHLALKLLSDNDGNQTDTAVSIMKKYEEIYVDEYQDCNSIQEAIFSLISRSNMGNPNVFMVGDMKQSIYKFRDANPKIFKQKLSTYIPYDREYPNIFNSITLNKNFRSRKEILDGVNAVFYPIMSENVGELDYSDDEALYSGARYEDKNPDMCSIDIVVIDSSNNMYSEDDDKISEENLSNLKAESEYVAQRVRKMIDDESYVVFDKELGIYRHIEYRDIVILLRSVKKNADEFSSALTRYDVPCFSDVGGGYFESVEIQTLICLLKTLNNPLDDISLVSVLRSGIYSFDDNDFLDIRLCSSDGYFYDALKKYANNYSDTLSDKINSFISDMDKYREASKFMSVDEFLWYIVNETNYLSFVGTLSNAQIRKANIRSLFNRAKQFESGDFKGMFNFINYIDKIRISGGEGDSAKALGENDNVVRIMSIHKSKGLEFPVVFLCMCGKKFNERDMGGSVLLHREMGLGIDYVDYEKRFSYPVITKNAIKEKIRIENLSEEQRVLYVTMTRPKEKLIITGVYQNAVESIDKIYDMVGTSEKVHTQIVSSAKNYLDWIIMAIAGNDETGSIYRGEVKSKNGALFSVNIINKNSVTPALDDLNETAYEIDSDLETDNSIYSEEIKRRLSYTYKYKSVNEFPSNVTVTEAKRLINRESETDYKMFEKFGMKSPQFLQDSQTLDAAYIGTLTHFVMQKIELTQTFKRDTIVSEVKRLVDGGFITAHEMESINVDRIFTFFQSPLGCQMRSSKNVRREVSFKLLIDASEIFAAPIKGEKLILQGTIDAYFEDENGGLVLIDYKTDSVREGIDVIKERYRVQIDLYAAALKTLTGKIVVRKCLYLFNKNIVIDY